MGASCRWQRLFNVGSTGLAGPEIAGVLQDLQNMQTVQTLAEKKKDNEEEIQ